MKKLVSLKKFEQKNSNCTISDKNSRNVFGGKSPETNNWCQTLDDTCVNNRSDLHHVKSIDGIVIFDHVCNVEEC
jgi:hypothetical protein